LNRFTCWQRSLDRVALAAACGPLHTLQHSRSPWPPSPGSASSPCMRRGAAHPLRHLQPP